MVWPCPFLTQPLPQGDLAGNLFLRDKPCPPLSAEDSGGEGGEILVSWGLLCQKSDVPRTSVSLECPPFLQDSDKQGCGKWSRGAGQEPGPLKGLKVP